MKRFLNNAATILFFALVGLSACRTNGPARTEAEVAATIEADLEIALETVQELAPIFLELYPDRAQDVALVVAALEALQELSSTSGEPLAVRVDNALVALAACISSVTEDTETAREIRLGLLAARLVLNRLRP